MSINVHPVVQRHDFSTYPVGQVHLNFSLPEGNLACPRNWTRNSMVMAVL